MKKITMSFCLLFLFCLIGFAQESTPTQKAPGIQLPAFVKNLTLTASLGTRGYSPAQLNEVRTQTLKQINLGEFGLSYQLNSHFSFGLSTMGSLGNCSAGYMNDEAGFVPFGDDDDDDDDPMDDPDDTDDSDDDDDDCEDDLGQNVMGTATFIFSEKLPFFLQAGVGYTFSKNAPAYSAMLGYRQKLFAGLGLTGGLRYSDVLYQKPAGATSLVHTSGIRAEFGLNWNF